jgi:hypothetical protein
MAPDRTAYAALVIPVAILIGPLSGLATRRLDWWTVGIVAVTWLVLLIATDVDSGLPFFVGSAALAAVNTIAGVAVGIAGRWLFTSILGHVRSHTQRSLFVSSGLFRNALDRAGAVSARGV